MQTNRSPAPPALLSLFLLVALLPLTAYCKQPAPATSVEAQYQSLLKETAASGRRLLIVFGADWCPDCHALDARLQEEPLKSFTGRNYLTMKVDVCRYDCNMDFAAKFGNPVAEGIPALVIVEGTGELIVATNNGEFSSARSMPAEMMLTFLREHAVQP